jgi:catechol 2,3-dioxygenase-like lactoylglutathione lyase family enzyme
MNNCKPTLGFRHIALYVEAFAGCEHFYSAILGLRVEWRPDADNVYLTMGQDNLALHRRKSNEALANNQRLDHIGLVLTEADDVDKWYDYLARNEVKLLTRPRTHRDGARSFYCQDPDGTTVQLIHHPPLAANY